jgi:hypothetical protein
MEGKPKQWQRREPKVTPGSTQAGKLPESVGGAADFGVPALPRTFGVTLGYEMYLGRTHFASHTGGGREIQGFYF